MSTRLYWCITKATSAEGDQMKYGLNWALSRRAILRVYNDHLECGDWDISNEQIKDAVLYSFLSFFCLPGYVLRITTDDKTYHFGLNGNRFWKGGLPFPVKREKGTLIYWPFGIVIRVIVVGCLCWMLWQWISDGISL